MKFLHGAMSMEVPDGWVDQSQIAFAEPIDRSIVEAMAKAAKESGAPLNLSDPGLQKPRSNFVISTKLMGVEGVDPRQFVQEELEYMMSQLQLGHQSELRWEQLAGHEAAVIEIELAYDNMTLRQLHALAVVDDRLVHFCGTATPGAFDKARGDFTSIMASLEIGA